MTTEPTAEPQRRMKSTLVIEFEVTSPDQMIEVLKSIDLPTLPCFTGVAIATVNPASGALINWLKAKAFIDGPTGPVRVLSDDDMRNP